MSVVAMAITRFACWSRSVFRHRSGGGAVFGAGPARHAKRLVVGLTGALVLALAVVAAPSAQAADDLGYSQLENRHKNWGALPNPVCLEVESADWRDGAHAVVDWCSQDGADQRWRFQDLGNGWFQIVVRSTGKCLDVAWGSWGDGAQVIQWTCDSNATNQQWRREYTSNGYFQLRARHSYKCLDKASWNVVQWTCSGAEWQSWRLR